MVNYWLMKRNLMSILGNNWFQTGLHTDGGNYQAGNIMRDDMLLGDMVLFYHSNCKPPHIAGIARVCKEAYPDHTAQDPGQNTTIQRLLQIIPDGLWSILNLYQHYLS